MAGRSRKSAPLTVLFTCVGRRVELLQAFRAAARRLNVELRIAGADSTATAPALSYVDLPVIAPRISEPAYIPTLLDTVKRHQVGGLIPTIDTDLLPISEQRDTFAAAGCQALIAEPDVIRTCRDKIETYQFLRSHNIDTPETFTPDEIRARAAHRFPYFIKPRFGSASRWVHKIDDEADLHYHLQKVDDPIVQEFVDGNEHTLDVYVGLDGQPRCVVPRMRWEVRTGEVSKGVVVKDPEVMEAGKRVVEALGPSVRGLVTLQCIVTADRRIRFIEINPRFGGGAPLGIAAGADYPGWLLQEWLGKKPQIAFDGFRHGMCMLRYDWSVFMPLDANLKRELNRPLRDAPPFA